MMKGVRKMRKIKTIIGVFTLLFVAFTIVGCGPAKNNDEYREPKVKESTLGEIRHMSDDDNLKASFQITVKVSGFGTSLNISEEINSKGNLKVTDLENNNETVLLGSTGTANALVWDKTKGIYTFTNPNDFLDNDLTKKIKIGDELTLIVVRDKVDDVCIRGIIKKVVEGMEEIIYKEPSIDILSLSEIINKQENLNMKKAYKTTVEVLGYGTGNDIAPKNAGSLKLGETGGNSEIVLFSSTATRDALIWNEKSGNYEYNIPNDFLTNEKTKDIKIGDKLDVIIVKDHENGTDKYYAIIIGVNSTEETLLTFANYTDKNLKVMVRKNNTRTRVVTLQTDIEDLSKVNVEFILSDEKAGEVTVVSKLDSSNHYYFGCFVTPQPSTEGTFTLKCLITSKETGVKLIEIEDLEVEIYTSYVALAVDTTKMPIKVIGSAFDGVVTLGYYSFNGNHSLANLSKYDVSNKITLPLVAMLSNGDEKLDYKKLIFTSSDERIIKIDDNGSFYLCGESGTVKLMVCDKMNPTINASLTLNVVNNGINIATYDELMEITTKVIGKEYVIVLKDDIKLAPKLENSGSTFDYELYAKSCVTMINPTTDVTYYKNIQKLDLAKIKYAVEISTDIYGNGYAISADNLTWQLYKKYGYRLYRGPLDLVRYNKDYNGSENNLAVKSQDDIIFVVLRDNINIINVELKGCNDESLIDVNGNFDLTNLDYCGTVLEIIGNNCNIKYSRINNGRNVVRVFGKAYQEDNVNATTSRISTTIANTLFTNAREFLLRIGTNQIVRNERVVNKMINNPTIDDYNHAAPYLMNGSTNYEINNNNYLDEYFYNNFILTDVTVQDSVFMNAGLFSVGLDTMFGGLVLHGWDFNDSFKFGSELGWGGVSGTSYPALLRLKGDVRFYDWKKVSTVNSDTLIEGLKNSDGSLSTIASKIGFNLDFSKLLSEYYKDHESILASYEGEPYVNGAIAYFGGGKNYSCVDTSDVSSSFTELVPYIISVDCFSPSNPRFIYYTAGLMDFRFLLYDASSNLSVAKQYNDISDNSAYDILKK